MAEIQTQTVTVKFTKKELAGLLMLMRRTDARSKSEAIRSAVKLALQSGQNGTAK